MRSTTWVEPVQLLNLLGIHIEQVLLDGAVWRDAHDDHPAPLVLHPLNEDPIQHLACRLHNGDGGAGGSDEPLLVVFPVLQQVFPKGLLLTNTPTMEATVSCILSFSAQRLAYLEIFDLRVSLSLIMPLNDLLVQMLFFLASSSLGTQSSPFSSCQVLTILILLKVWRTHVL